MAFVAHIITQTTKWYGMHCKIEFVGPEIRSSKKYFSFKNSKQVVNKRERKCFKTFEKENFDYRSKGVIFLRFSCGVF